MATSALDDTVGAPPTALPGSAGPSRHRRILAVALLCGVLLLLASVLLAAPDEKSLDRGRTLPRGSTVTHTANPRC